MEKTIDNHCNIYSIVTEENKGGIFSMLRYITFGGIKENMYGLIKPYIVKGVKCNYLENTRYGLICRNQDHLIRLHNLNMLKEERK